MWWTILNYIGYILGATAAHYWGMSRGVKAGVATKHEESFTQGYHEGYETAKADYWRTPQVKGQ